MMKSSVIIFIAFLTGFVLPVLASPSSPPPPLYIKSDTMEVVDQGHLLKFHKNVKATRGRDRLLCDELESDKSKHFLHAQGRVAYWKPTDTGETWEAFGDEAHYDTLGDSITLRAAQGRARIIKHPLNSTLNTIQLTGRQMATNSSVSYAHAEEDVYGQTISTSTSQLVEFWAEDAVFNDEQSFIHLQGKRPIVIVHQPTETRRIEGDSIHYDIDAEQLIVTGNGIAKIFPKKNSP